MDIVETNTTKHVYDNRVSVDCIVLGFDSEQLNVLLVKRTGEDQGKAFRDMKLPGSPIYVDENIDDAAKRVLSELTGLQTISMTQFKAFGSIERTQNPKDLHWLEEFTEVKMGRVITIAYIALIKIDKSITRGLNDNLALWLPISNVGDLAFDHNQILNESVAHIRSIMKQSPNLMFDLLPRKFTIYQLRKLYETIFQTKIDPGNFYKKLAMMPYVVPLEEMEEGKAHRAARFYKFDKKIYRKSIVD